MTFEGPFHPKLFYDSVVLKTCDCSCLFPCKDYRASNENDRESTTEQERGYISLYSTVKLWRLLPQDVAAMEILLQSTEQLEKSFGDKQNLTLVSPLLLKNFLSHNLKRCCIVALVLYLSLASVARRCLLQSDSCLT